MTTTLDTEDWKLAAYLDWKPKKEPIEVECSHCCGQGKVGGGFKSLDDPTDCQYCFGRGYRTEPGVKTPKPEMPKELVEHMRKALFEYCEKHSQSTKTS